MRGNVKGTNLRVSRARVVLRVVHTGHQRVISTVLAITVVRGILANVRAVFAGRCVALLRWSLGCWLVGVYACGQEGWAIFIAVKLEEESFP